MPIPPITVETWMEAMAEAHQSGLISAVGVSNYDRDQTQRAYDTLIRQGIELASNQVEYHLLNRKIEQNGLMQQCKDLGVTIIAYSPLALGLLTGKYTPEHPPQGARGGRITKKYLAQIQPLISMLRRIGADHAGKTPAQVALNWVIYKGALAIPGAKNLNQLEQNAGALGWSISDEEAYELESLAERIASGE
jgi:aryl-alcohol dehydrogenase-like predicted oxidoreductase